MSELRPLKEQIVVITGGSSGIGRETARQFGAAGAHVVLAARGQQALEEAAEEVRAAGGTASVVPTDVSDWDAVEQLAQFTVEQYGRIDTWVNCAGINVFGRVQDTPAHEHKRVIDVCLLGQVHGMKAALPQMIREGRGSIVNVSAAAAVRSTPLQAAFSAAMHGVRGFTETFRTELANEHPEIALCIVMPASVNTPFYAHAKSHLEGAPRPLPPVYQPGSVAEIILSAATDHHRDVFVGVWGELLEMVDAFDPSILDSLAVRRSRALEGQVIRGNGSDDDNLYSPMAPDTYSAEGRWSAEAVRGTFYSRYLQIHPKLERTLVLGSLLSAIGGTHLLTWWLGRRAHRRKPRVPYLKLD